MWLTVKLQVDIAVGYHCQRFYVVSVRVLQKEVLYKSHGTGRLLTQSTVVVFWPSWYRPAQQSGPGICGPCPWEFWQYLNVGSASRCIRLIFYSVLFRHSPIWDFINNLLVWFWTTPQHHSMVTMAGRATSFSEIEISWEGAWHRKKTLWPGCKGANNAH
jgi:hypothetical protein